MTAQDSETFDSLLRGVAASPRALLLGKEVLAKRFRLRRRLGEGGFGVVYEAEDLRDGGRVALKLLRDLKASWLSRFKREFRALQGIVHPNLIVLDQLFGDAERWFFTMELIEGVNFIEHAAKSRAEVAATDSTLSADGFLAPQEAALSFSSGVRAPDFDEQKLRGGLRQLMEGLAALHASGRVHRDIKPSNVLVAHSGRVVLIDFGLVTDVIDKTGSVTMGTPAYMAPEQAAAREVGPAADLYAVGAMLYEVLTGTLPVRGTALQVLMAKQTWTPAAPATVASNVPEDLSDLCMQLLRCDPSERPTTTEVCRSLAAKLAPTASIQSSRPPAEPAIFVGRGKELAVLRAAFEEARRSAAAALLVHGESGIGKTHLVRHFMHHIAAEHPSAILLEGRCYEREAIPYKALDGIVEGLTRRLMRMPSTEVDALLPTRRALLGTVFPSLLRIPQLAKLDREQACTSHPDGELRQRAFLELRELFTRVAMHRPTVLFIDDLQWADDDGLLALSQVLPGPDAPPLLFVGAMRTSDHELASSSEMQQALGIKERDIVELRPLESGQARDLAAALLAIPDAVQFDATRIAAHAAGHPLFVEELVRHARTSSQREQVSLAQMINSRVFSLEAPARDVVELVAVSGVPLPQQVVAFAADLDGAHFRRQVATLRACNLVRTSGDEWSDAIAPYHDRVHEAVLAQLAPIRRQELHGALARAFEATEHLEPERLAVHWLEAGEARRAVRYAVQAGDHATRLFAFERASTWFKQALDLLHEDERTAGLHEKLANALAFSGRGASAAPHFERAAALAPPVVALALRRRAAVQLLLSGHFDRGLAASRLVLREVGVTLPTRRLHILAARWYFDTVLRLRGIRFRERPADQLTAPEKVRIDTCFSMASALAFSEPGAASVFQTRALLLALSAGDRSRIARSLAMQAAFKSTGGRKQMQRTTAMLECAKKLADGSSDARVRVTMSLAEGIIHFDQGSFADAAKQTRQTLALVEDGSMRGVHARSTIRIVMMQVLAFLGRFAELQRVLRQGLRDAAIHQNVYDSVNLRIASGEWGKLLDDRPDLAEREVQNAIDEWSQQGFHFEHRNALIARIAINLYAGETQQSHALARDLLKVGRRSLLWGEQLGRFRVWYSLGRTSLAMLCSGLGDRARLIREVRRAATAIECEQTPWMKPFSRVLRGGIALQEGALAAASAALVSAECEFSAQHLTAYAAATRYHAARLRNDDTTSAEVAQARAVLLAEDVVNPERLFNVLVPGFRA